MRRAVSAAAVLVALVVAVAVLSIPSSPPPRQPSLAPWPQPQAVTGAAVQQEAVRHTPSPRDDRLVQGPGPQPPGQQESAMPSPSSTQFRSQSPPRADLQMAPVATQDSRQPDLAPHLEGGDPMEHLVWLPWERPATDTAAEAGEHSRHAYPLLVFLHGAGEADSSLEFLHTALGATGAVPQLAMLTAKTVAQQPAEDPYRWNVSLAFFDRLVVAATLSRNTWLNDDDCEAAEALIGSLLVKYPQIDPGRVVITGVSQGGFGALRIASSAPTRFAGVASVCGFGEPDMVRSLVRADADLLFVHGANDEIAARFLMQSIEKRGLDGALSGCAPAEPFVDASGAVAPAYLMQSFTDKRDQALLQRIFAVPLKRAASDHLEEVAKAFDLFRARHTLPVVPPELSVRNAGERTNMFENLTFITTNDAAVDRKSILHTPKSGTVEVTAHARELDRTSYGHPSAKGHPAIDRWCFASHGEKKTVLVIYQDKMNDDMREVVDSLNNAADALKAALEIDVLCVAHVVGVGETQCVQSDFRHPYMLVGSQQIEDFYAPSFAPAVRFIVARHTARPKKSGQPARK